MKLLLALLPALLAYAAPAAAPFAPVSARWAGAVAAAYRAPAASLDGLHFSLESFKDVDASVEASRARLSPIVGQLEKLGVDPEAFSAMAPAGQRAVLHTAALLAAAEVEVRAAALFEGPDADPARGLAFLKQFGAYLEPARRAEFESALSEALGARLDELSAAFARSEQESGEPARAQAEIRPRFWHRYENRFIFQGERSPSETYRPAEAVQASIPTADGLTLYGWHVPAAPGAATVLYAYGNAGTVDNPWVARLAEAFARRGLGFLAFDYRGYGRSPGLPSERGVYEDVRAASRHLESLGVGPERQVAFGLSMGGAVVIDAAARLPFRAVVSVATFTSMRDMAGAVKGLLGFPRWLPVQLFIMQRFDSARKVRRVGSPMLIIHGEADEVAPVWMADSLAAARGASWTELWKVEGADHNTLLPMKLDAVIDRLQAFLVSTGPLLDAAVSLARARIAELRGVAGRESALALVQTLLSQAAGEGTSEALQLVIVRALIGEAPNPRRVAYARDMWKAVESVAVRSASLRVKGEAVAAMRKEMRSAYAYEKSIQLTLMIERVGESAGGLSKIPAPPPAPIERRPVSPFGPRLLGWTLALLVFGVLASILFGPR